MINFQTGNPFKIDKRMMVDEADIDIVGATSSTSKGGLKRTLPQSDGGSSPSLRPSPNKRKPGPIPKDVIVRRPSYSPTNTPPSSPIPWIEEAKTQVTVTVPVVDSNNSPNLTCTLNVSSHISSYTNVQPEKLVNGLAEMPTIPIFEPIPVETVNNHMDTPPTLAPIINNINDASKGDGKSERTDSGFRNECSRLSVNDCVVENSVKIDSAVEERLTNHVEEKRGESKPEREKKLTRKELEDIRRHNLSIRELVYKEVRRRGTSKPHIPKRSFLSFYISKIL